MWTTTEPIVRVVVEWNGREKRKQCLEFEKVTVYYARHQRFHASNPCATITIMSCQDPLTRFLKCVVESEDGALVFLTNGTSVQLDDLTDFDCNALLGHGGAGDTAVEIALINVAAIAAVDDDCSNV
jgi:hypothetical protein